MSPCPMHRAATQRCGRLREVLPVVAVALVLVFFLLVPSRPAGAVEVSFEVAPGGLPNATGSFVFDDGVVLGLVNANSPPMWSFVWERTTVDQIIADPGLNLGLVARSADDQYTGYAHRSPPATGIEIVAWDRTNGLQRGGSLDGGLRADGVGFIGSTIVGTSNTASADDTLRAIRWTPGGSLTELDALSDRASYVGTADGSHVAAGVSTDADGVVHLVRWVDLGPVEDLGRLDGAENINVRTIGADGSIYGSLAQGSFSVFAWHPGSGLSIRAVPAWVDVEAVNRHGQWAANTANHAIRLEPDGTVTTLDAEEDPSRALAINDRGQIVGAVTPAGSGTKGFLWDPECGLSDLGDQGGALFPHAISNNGLVTGNYGSAGSTATAFRMQVRLEPCTPEAVPTDTWGLRWETVDGRDAAVSGYRIYRDGVAIATTTAETTTWADPEPAVGAHAYELTAVNRYGESARSDPVILQASGPATAPPAAAVAARPAFAG